MTRGVQFGFGVSFPLRLACADAPGHMKISHHALQDGGPAISYDDVYLVLI